MRATAISDTTTELTGDATAIGTGTLAVTVVAAPASGLTGSTLAAGVTASSLTSIGTLVAGAVPASLVTSGTFGTGPYTFPGGISRPIRTANTTTNVTTSDHTILGNAAGGAMTANLPTAASASGHQFTIKKIDSSANAVTIDGDGSETIDGATTVAITLQWESVTVQSNGTAWYIL